MGCWPPCQLWMALLFSLWCWCWTEALRPHTGFPGLGGRYSLALPALGLSLPSCPVLCSLAVALAGPTFSVSQAPSALSPTDPFPHSSFRVLPLPPEGCLLGLLAPHTPASLTPSLPRCYNVTLLSSPCSFLFCFLSLWQGLTVCCVLPDPPAPPASQRPPRRQWRRACRDC